MTNEFRQVEPTVGDARRRRCTTERKLQIIEERYPRGDGFLCGAAVGSRAKSPVSLAQAPDQRGRFGGGLRRAGFGSSQVKKPVGRWMRCQSVAIAGSLPFLMALSNEEL